MSPNQVGELEVIRRLQHAQVSQGELMDIYNEFQKSNRVLMHLIQHPRFPAHQALGILSRLFMSDLLAVIKNQRTNPFVRKRAEMEMKIRFQRSPLGEKLALLKSAPYSLLMQFTDESNKMILEAIFFNPNCTEDLVLRFINRGQDRAPVYDVLDRTVWHTNAAVATAIAHDPEAPIKMVLKIIPYAGLPMLQALVADENCHQVVRSSILRFLEDRLLWAKE